MVNTFFLKKNEIIELHNLLKAMGLYDSGDMAKTAIVAGSVKVTAHEEYCKLSFRSRHAEAHAPERISIPRHRR
jgi:ribosomal protein S17